MHSIASRYRRRGTRTLRNMAARLTMGVWVVVPLLPALGALLSWVVGLR